MSDRARRVQLPHVLPEILAVHVDHDDHIWLRRWPRAGRKETLFDVFAPDGTMVSTVRVPADLLHQPVPWVSLVMVAGVVRDDATHTERVTLFTLPRRQ